MVGRSGLIFSGGSHNSPYPSFLEGMSTVRDGFGRQHQLSLEDSSSLTQRMVLYKKTNHEPGQAMAGFANLPPGEVVLQFCSE